MIVIARSLSQTDAFLMKARLDEALIPSVVDGQHLVGMIGYAGGPGEVQLKVAEADVTRAEHVLAERRSSAAAPGDEELADGVRHERRRWRRFVWLYFVLTAAGIAFALLGDWFG